MFNILEPWGKSRNSLDLLQSKRVDGLSATENWMRIGLSGLTAVVVWQAYDLPELMGLWVLFALAMLFRSALIQRLPNNVNQVGQWKLVAGAVVSAAIYLFGLGLLWMQPHIALQSVALVGLCMLMVDSLYARSDFGVMLITDIGVVAVGIILLPTLCFMYSGDPVQSITVLVALVAAFAFYLTCLREALLTRRNLFRAKQAEFDRARHAALGRLTGGVAHDFNNLLTVISGNLELMREVTDPAEKAILADEASEAAQRAAQVTSQLLSFSRQSVLATKAVDVAASIDGVQGLLNRLLPETISVQTDVDPGLPHPVVDQSNLENVLVNLCLNARDAMPDGGTIRIGAHLVQLKEGGFSGADGPLPAGEYVSLQVSDSGGGIPEEALAQVIEPYFTTKPLGKGSGLGLSMAKGFAEQSGGALSIASRFGVGTQVILLFPVPQA